MDPVKQLPLRGIAMILIAVALMLGAWGVYSVTSDNSSSAPKTSTAETSEQTPAEKSAPQAPAVSDTPAASDAPGESAAPAEKAPADKPADKPAADKPAAERPVPVRVLNNSTVQGLAAQVADTLRSRGIDVVEVGNLPDAVVPQTTVFYPAGHQAQAQKIADQLHAVIAQHDNPDIVVVTVQ
ncbi:LytR C-terminal domain-containing protein [Corynebacterium diphtheriae]|uniref:LytR C-terminal domain-containing protein n=1 Tax=Corynebacterium diphtheriae TaxID=1717 RepID=UPI00403D8D5D